MTDSDNNPETASESALGEYRFQVDDGKPILSTDPILTGAQIKALAGIQPDYGLYLEARGNDSDTKITDGSSVDLRQPGVERFYTVPPATFGER